MPIFAVRARIGEATTQVEIALCPLVRMTAFGAVASWKSEALIGRKRNDGFEKETVESRRWLGIDPTDLFRPVPHGDPAGMCGSARTAMRREVSHSVNGALAHSYHGRQGPRR